MNAQSISLRRRLRPSVDWVVILIGAPGAVLLVGLFILPIAYMTWRSVSDPVLGFGHYIEFFASPTYVRIILRTIWTSLVCVVGCLIIGTPIAYGLAHFPTSKVLRITLGVLVGCFLMSSLVRAFAWMVLLGANGPIVFFFQLFNVPIGTLLSTSQGVLLGMIHYLLPIYILTAFAGLRSVPVYLVGAAEGMGATHGYALLTVYLPLARPALVNASSLVFVTALGFFITPALLGGPADTMLAQLIAQSVSRFGQFALASAVGFVLLATTLLFLGFARWLLRSSAVKRIRR
jgi:putative spermidine/putrescine transport system permease protein